MRPGKLFHINIFSKCFIKCSRFLGTSLWKSHHFLMLAKVCLQSGKWRKDELWHISMGSNKKQGKVTKYLQLEIFDPSCFYSGRKAKMKKWDHQTIQSHFMTKIRFTTFLILQAIRPQFSSYGLNTFGKKFAIWISLTIRSIKILTHYSQRTKSSTLKNTFLLDSWNPIKELKQSFEKLHLIFPLKDHFKLVFLVYNSQGIFFL